MFENAQKSIAARIRSYFAEHNIPQPDEIKWNPVPFSGEWGISTSFFQTAAQEARTGKRVNVPQRAQEIAEGVAEMLAVPEGFSRAEAVRGYLNLYFDSAAFSLTVVDTVLAQGADFGRGSLKGERVMVEYAQPNTHHSFHIGHYRNAILGEALARLTAFAGFETVRAAYPGDIGLGVITVLWMYDKFYRGQEPQGIHERGQWLLKLYVEATQLLTEKPDETPEEQARREAYDAERREMYRRWDAGDPEVRQLWLETREWSLVELREILRMMDIEIDAWFFESEVDEPAKAIVHDLIELGIADDERPDGGAVIVRIDEKLGLKKEKYRTNVILRNDGTTLYLTKDLALAKIKFEQYRVDRSVYVVDVRQSLHLQQTFAILKLWGFSQAEQCYHLGYGFVSLPEGAMSARRGRVVLFKDVYDEAIRRVLAEIAVKNPDLPASERTPIAQIVGMGALAYAMLSVDNNKDIVFHIDEALSFDGHTGPYIQNAYVRASSILRKAGGYPEQADFDYALEPLEVELIDLISRFPGVVQQAAQEYRPLVMATYAYDLAAAFHKFYHVVRVLQADTAPMRDARLRLVAAARQTLANALRLLAIKAPEKM
ncbi:MAG TPA: arginine--tRNA ligase [Anaerolineales bacterium]|nr:arginine--tRNA ligase [Anaerolineales bacterium]